MSEHWTPEMFHLWEPFNYAVAKKGIVSDPELEYLEMQIDGPGVSFESDE